MLWRGNSKLVVARRKANDHGTGNERSRQGKPCDHPPAARPGGSVCAYRAP